MILCQISNFSANQEQVTSGQHQIGQPNVASSKGLPWGESICGCPGMPVQRPLCIAWRELVTPLRMRVVNATVLLAITSKSHQHVVDPRGDRQVSWRYRSADHRY